MNDLLRVTLEFSRGNGYVESLIGKLRDDLLNGKIFVVLLETGVFI